MPEPQLSPWQQRLLPQNASVFDPSWLKTVRALAHVMGVDDPVTAIMGAAGPSPDPNEGGAVGYLAQRFPKFAEAIGIKAYHGSPRQFSELQPGSMMTTDPAWAAGYTTQMAAGIGPEQFVGKVHGATVPITPDRTLVATSLHDAEDKLLKLASSALGRPARTLREAAEAVTAKYGYEAIAAKNAAGEFTGVIPLHSVTVGEHLDPRRVVNQALASKKPVASNLEDISRRDTFTVYHGSPHEFDRFDVSKVGTGEGGDAYGHGLYFSEHPEVAKTYQHLDDQEGHLYQAAIKTAKENFLDYDRPLREQHPVVQRALQQFGASLDDTGGQAYGKVLELVDRYYPKHQQPSEALASRVLNQHGVAGIKYLDQGSRAAGEGSRNYVVFDDKLVDILRKYGILLPIAGAAGAKGLAPEPSTNGEGE